MKTLFPSIYAVRNQSTRISILLESPSWPISSAYKHFRLFFRNYVQTNCVTNTFIILTLNSVVMNIQFFSNLTKWKYLIDWTKILEHTKACSATISFSFINISWLKDAQIFILLHAFQNFIFKLWMYFINRSRKRNLK